MGTASNSNNSDTRLGQLRQDVWYVYNRHYNLPLDLTQGNKRTPYGYVLEYILWLDYPEFYSELTMDDKVKLAYAKPGDAIVYTVLERFQLWESFNPS